MPTIVVKVRNLPGCGTQPCVVRFTEGGLGSHGQAGREPAAGVAPALCGGFVGEDYIIHAAEKGLADVFRKTIHCGDAFRCRVQ